MTKSEEKRRARHQAETALLRGRLLEAARAYGRAWAVLRALDGALPTPEDVRVEVMAATAGEAK